MHSSKLKFKIKVVVKKMAVYTKLSEDDLKEFFSKYDLGELLDHKGIKDGIENTNYFIRTKKGKFILTVYEKRVDEMKKQMK